MKKLAKYSFGIGDRFAHQASWQLKAIYEIEKQGTEVTPVWNKSNREHTTIGSEPADNRKAAQIAIQNMGWDKPWFIDADHITLDTVDRFLESSDFFTIDVANYIGKKGDPQEEEYFIAEMSSFIGTLKIPGIDSTFEVTEQKVRNIAKQYLFATYMAGKTYQYIEKIKEKEILLPKSQWMKYQHLKRPLIYFLF